MNSYLQCFLAAFIILSFAKLYPQGLQLPSTKSGTDSTITISFIGDLMCHSPQFNYAEAGKDSFDFKPVYRFIKPYLTSSDFLIGNLETVTAGKERGYTGYPLFNTPDEYIEALKYSGFDLLVTANNHSLDKGKKGLLRTIKKIEEQDLVNTGTYRSKEERDSIVIFSVDSIKFTVLAYSYSTNGIPVPKGEDFLVNLIDTTLIRGDIERAKQEDLDFIIVFYHFGNEYKTSPSAYQEEVVNKTIKYGADIIIGSHPHVVQPVRFFKTNNGNLDTGFVAYSLGNFVSNQRWRYSDGGPILNLSITKDFERDSVFISNVKIVPTWVFKGKTERGNEYIILPSDSILAKGQYSFLTEEDRINLVQNYFDTKNVMLKESPPVSVYSPSEELRIYLKNLIPFN